MIHHHKPSFSGDLTGKGLANNGTTVTGKITCTVLNGPLDSHFKAGTYAGQYGSLTTDESGNFTYTVAAGNPAVSGLATSATLTDNIVVPSHYTWKGIIGPTVAITITGH